MTEATYSITSDDMRNLGDLMHGSSVRPLGMLHFFSLALIEMQVLYGFCHCGGPLDEWLGLCPGCDGDESEEQ